MSFLKGVKSWMFARPLNFMSRKSSFSKHDSGGHTHHTCGRENLRFSSYNPFGSWTSNHMTELMEVFYKVIYIWLKLLWMRLSRILLSKYFLLPQFKVEKPCWPFLKRFFALKSYEFPYFWRLFSDEPPLPSSVFIFENSIVEHIKCLEIKIKFFFKE